LSQLKHKEISSRKPSYDSSWYILTLKQLKVASDADQVVPPSQSLHLEAIQHVKEDRGSSPAQRAFALRCRLIYVVVVVVGKISRIVMQWFLSGQSTLGARVAVAIESSAVVG
jgi:hypothetical protein